MHLGSQRNIMWVRENKFNEQQKSHRSRCNQMSTGSAAFSIKQWAPCRNTGAPLKGFTLPALRHDGFMAHVREWVNKILALRQVVMWLVGLLYALRTRATRRQSGSILKGADPLAAA